MIVGRHWYFILSFSLPLMALIFCALVYQAGQYEDFQVGGKFLSGIPNYYFFFAVVLPFIAAGVMYLAKENRNIRFFGELDAEMDDKTRNRVLRYRKILLAFAVLASVLIVIQDAGEKTTALPPYSIALESAELEQVTAFFACQKQWLDDDGCGLLEPQEQSAAYFQVLQDNGFQGTRISGFDSFGHWLEQSSWQYKLESLLSLFAALIVSLLFAQIALLIMSKQYIRDATKSLVIWIVVLASFWFPTKVISSRQSNLGEYATPSILAFGAVILVIAILLIIFLKMERNDLSKFASLAMAVFSALISSLSYLKPDYTDKAIELLAEAGIIYSTIACLVLMFSLYLVTDHFFNDYELETTTDA